MLSVVRPISWIGSSYLQVKNRPRTIMILESTKPVALIVLMIVFATLGPRVAGPDVLGRLGTGESWACAAVGVVFALNSLSYMWVFKRTDGLSLSAQLAELLPPVMACVPMVAAVVVAERALGAAGCPPVVRLLVEIGVGAAVFVPSAFVLAPSTSREFVALLRAALTRRRSPARA